MSAATLDKISITKRLPSCNKWLKLYQMTTNVVYNVGMSRPNYETASDLAKEAEVIAIYAQAYALTPVKLKPSLIVDYGLMRDKRMVGVAEVKVRKQSYPELFISLHKVQEMRKHVMDGTRARVIFATPDGIYVQKVEFDPVSPSIQGWIGIAGRTDRADASDMEPVVYWPMTGMERIADSKQEWFHG